VSDPGSLAARYAEPGSFSIGTIMPHREQHERAKAQAKAARQAKKEELVKQQLIAQAAFNRKPKEGPFDAYMREKAPKLVGDKRLEQLAKLGQLRSINSWEPNTKSRERQFISLCEHLLAKYPVPNFLWNVFDIKNHKLLSIILRIAKGESLYKLAQAGEIFVVLTRKACHLFLNNKEGKILDNLRTAQVISLGGDNHLAQSICKSRIGRDIEDELEDFYYEFMQWCVNNPMFPHNQIDPILDYILRELRPNTRNFSMKGRTPTALLREMERWHGTLRGEGRRRFSIPEKFPSSGFKPFYLDRSTSKNMEIWTIKEILTSQELRSEGMRMRHCVFSYWREIVEKKVSIWSLSVKRNDGDYSVCTIEVKNEMRNIVQVRGPCNRLPEMKSVDIIKKWSKVANLNY
jgi:hypothetical protein